MGVFGKRKPFWKITASSSSSSKSNSPPKEFLCPISGSLMFDPVVVSSGQTFELSSVTACKQLGFIPLIEFDSALPPSPPDFTSFIRNLNLKSSILSWCTNNGVEPPAEPIFDSIVNKVRSQMISPPDSRVEAHRMNITNPVIRVSDKEMLQVATDVADTGSSQEIVPLSPAKFNELEPFPLSTRPAISFYTSSSVSSSEIQEVETLDSSSLHTLSSSQSIASSSTSSPSFSEEDSILVMLTSSEIHEQENGVKLLRKVSRFKDSERKILCTIKFVASLKPLIVSRYAIIQTNALAGLVNLSLNKKNKESIVRAGMIPLLVDILKSGSGEAQEHATGALFSLALEEEHRMAIGALGALEPLMHILTSSDRNLAIHDSARALYNLSLAKVNRRKLVQMEAVAMLLGMIEGRKYLSDVLPVLYNLAACDEGRAVMLSSNGVGMLVEVLREGEKTEYWAVVHENCVATLFAVSKGSIRFKMLATEAGAVEVLRKIEQTGNLRAKEKAARLLMQIASGSSDGPNRLLAIDSVPPRGAICFPNSANF